MNVNNKWMFEQKLLYVDNIWLHALIWKQPKNIAIIYDKSNMHYDQMREWYGHVVGDRMSDNANANVRVL